MQNKIEFEPCFVCFGSGIQNGYRIVCNIPSVPLLVMTLLKQNWKGFRDSRIFNTSCTFTNSRNMRIFTLFVRFLSLFIYVDFWRVLFKRRIVSRSHSGLLKKWLKNSVDPKSQKSKIKVKIYTVQNTNSKKISFRLSLKRPPKLFTHFALKFYAHLLLHRIAHQIDKFFSQLFYSKSKFPVKIQIRG